MKIIFLGGQGSGKSTQAELLSKKLNLPNIQMGEIFRKKAKENDDLAKLIKSSLDAGNLVPDDVAVKTLQDVLQREEYKNGYILDGYPRNSAQMDGLDTDIDKVFYIKVSDIEAINRLMLRAREDDTHEALTRRLKIYHEQTEPLLKIFNEKGILEEINGERTIEEIHKEITAKFHYVGSN